MLRTALGAAATPPKKPTFKYMLRATHGVVPAIVRGPDGRVWFPEQFADEIGAITAKGVVTHYRAGAKNGQPNTITLGPDGNLWYTLYGTGNVGRMTPAGKPQRVQYGCR